MEDNKNNNIANNNLSNFLENTSLIDIFNENVKQTYKIALSNEDLVDRYKLNRIKKSKNEFDEEMKFKEQLNKTTSNNIDKSSSIYRLIKENKFSDEDNSKIIIDRALIEKGFNILS